MGRADITSPQTLLRNLLGARGIIVLFVQFFQALVSLRNDPLLDFSSVAAFFDRLFRLGKIRVLRVQRSHS